MGAWIETSSAYPSHGWQLVAPLWVRGLKLAAIAASCLAAGGRPMGAWIETASWPTPQQKAWVAPLWVRGLKQHSTGMLGCRKGVAPLWVRGLKHPAVHDLPAQQRRTLMGAWIETWEQRCQRLLQRVAPLWVRGLKQSGCRTLYDCSPSHPYGCVD